jgi:hypothetical protein
MIALASQCASVRTKASCAQIPNPGLDHKIKTRRATTNISPGRWRQTSSFQLVLVELVRFRHPLAADAIDNRLNFLGRRQRWRLALNHLHCRTLRRIEPEQGWPAFIRSNPFPTSRSSRALARNAAANWSSSINSTAQKLIAINFDRMPVQGHQRLRNRETVVCSKGAHALVDDLAVVHGN